MSDWDSVSSPAAPAQVPSEWDAVSAPAESNDNAPKLPDAAPIQNTVKNNLAAQNQPSVDGTTRTPQVQTPAQKLDTGLGFSASSALAGSAPQTPLPAAIRGHIVDAYKNGTATTAGDYFQSALPAAAAMLNPAAAVGSAVGQFAANNGIIDKAALSTYRQYQGARMLIGDVLSNADGLALTPEQTQAMRTYGASLTSDAKKNINDANFADSLATPQGLSTAGRIGYNTLSGVAEGVPALASMAIGGPAAGAAMFAGQSGLEEAGQVGARGGTTTQQVLAGGGTAGVNAAMSVIPMSYFTKALGKTGMTEFFTNLFGHAAPTMVGSQVANSAIDTAVANPKKTWGEWIQEQPEQVGTALLSALTFSGIGAGFNAATGEVPGHSELKLIVAKSLGKPPGAVTPADINHSIMTGFDSTAPHAQDFQTTAKVIAWNAGPKISGPGALDVYPNSKDIENTLYQTYRETGVHPDQVFEDAKNNPDVARELMQNKVPTVYDNLREQTSNENTDNTDKSSSAGQPPQEPPSGNESPSEEPEEGVPSNRSTEGASVSANPLRQIFDPTNISESSRDMATALRQAKGPAAQETAQIQSVLESHAKQFNKMSDAERLQLIGYMENRSSGAEIHDSELQGVADKIKDIYAQMGQKVQEAFPDVGLRRDYFTHQYEDEDAAAKFFNDFVAKQGSERNLQERAFPTLAEAMRAGLKPKTTNPIETVMNYVTNMNNLIAAHRGVQLAIEGGVADYFRRGQQPSGWVPLNGNLAESGGKILYAPEDAARVYNNDISEKASGPAGQILDNIQRANNFASKLVLGLSGYHATATTMAAMSSDVARAFLPDAGGLKDRAGALASAVTAPVSHYLQGSKLIDAYLGRSELPPGLQQAMDLAVKNNTINVKQQDYWKAGPAKDYIDAFKTGKSLGIGETLKEHKITGPVRVLANEVGRTMDTISKPLFDYYIPRLKISANINELHDWLQAHPDATPQEQDRAAQDIGNSIDNRFGEMMRDNLFWHQLTRQTLQTGLLSYSWVAGGARMLKGIPDAGLALIRQKELSANARYLFGMAATYAAVNATTTYLHTGKAPDDWRDYIYPRTGGTTPQGKPEREILPGHTSQFTNYLHDGLGEVGNELSPGLKLAYHLTSNSDFRGLPITNANNPWFGEQRWGDYAKYVLGEETPIGLKNFLQGNKKGSQITTGEKLLGARAAPEFVTDPKDFNEMMTHINDKAFQKKVRSDKKMAAQYENSEDD